MVAITAPAPSIARPRPARAPVQLRLVSAGIPRGTSWARLAGVVLAVLVVSVAALYLARAEPAAAPGTGALLDTTHTVAEGETMWSIASRVAPAGEATTYVERLVAANGTATVAPGQVLALPVP